jgi:hypothetical protein
VLGIEITRATIAAALIRLLTIVGTFATVLPAPTPNSRYWAADLGDLHQNNRTFDERSVVASPSDTAAAQQPIPAPGTTTVSAEDEIRKWVSEKLTTWVPEKLRSIATSAFGPFVGSVIVVLAFVVVLLWKTLKGWKDIGEMRLWVMKKLGRAPPESEEPLLVGAALPNERDDLVGLRILREKVKRAWIHGVLEESFSSRPMIELDKEIDPAEVEPPIDAKGHLTQPAARKMPLSQFR